VGAERGENAAPNRSESPPDSPRVRRWTLAGLFLYLWLMVGFASGTATLLGPTRWLKTGLERWGLAAYENQSMWVVILLFVAGSFLLARWLHAVVIATRLRAVRAGIPLTATALAALAFVGWADPSNLSGLAGAEQHSVALASGAEFVFGPYPDGRRLAELRQQGFTAVISLQHPAVVPIEPQGIEAERRTARELGIEFIHAPMLPWISDNEQSLALIREIAGTRQGKFYVHCGLGRDRANVVRAMLERLGTVRVVAAPDLKPVRTFADRVAEGRFLMERGNFQILEDSLWLVPWPNAKEGFGKILGGQVRHVMVVMDTTDAEQAAWAAEARKLFSSYGVAHSVETVRADEEAALLTAARAVREVPRPAIVLVPRTPPCRDARLALAFMAAWERAGGLTRAAIRPGDGDPKAEGRPLPCEQG
jgi:protein tyrosine phosphatase (PTP) superfamily phosphohydrolase (DUF442 family)